MQAGGQRQGLRSEHRPGSPGFGVDAPGDGTVGVGWPDGLQRGRRRYASRSTLSRRKSFPSAALLNIRRSPDRNVKVVPEMGIAGLAQGTVVPSPDPRVSRKLLLLPCPSS